MVQPRQDVIRQIPKKKRKQAWNMKRNWPLHVLVIPAILLAIIFNYIP